MPVLNSLLDHQVLGREFKKGLAEGLEKGLEEGLEKGREEGHSEGETYLLHRMLVRRFRKLPKWAEVRLASAGRKDLEAWGERLLDAKTLRDVFSADRP